MQFASFDLADPVFDGFGRRFSFQLGTLENLYGLDAERAAARTSGDTCTISSEGLAYAGQQQRDEAHPGEIEVARRLQRAQHVAIDVGEGGRRSPRGAHHACPPSRTTLRR